MRSVLFAALLITSMFALPAASAKSFAEDAAGDTTSEAFGLPVIPAPLPAAEAADLLSLDIVEDAEELTLTLKVAGMPTQSSFANYEIYFTWAKDEYLIDAYRQVMDGVIDESTRVVVMNLEAEDRYDTLAELDHTVDASAGLFTIRLPKAYLLDDRGRYPTLGDQLKDVYVGSSSQVSIFGFGVDSNDRMPDGEDTLKYDFLYGDIAKGHLRIDADERVRVSNGGATTFVYKVAIQNTGEVDDQVTILLDEMPEGWNGTVQSPIRIPGGAERTVAVLVSVPFAHEHGGFSSFNLSARSDNDRNSVAAIRLGVLHTPIPQPAGHHADLYLHAENFNSGFFGDVFPFTGAAMNTDGDHATDAPEASPWRSTNNGFVWYIPLTPVLRMGLDFDLDKTGTLAGSVIGHMMGSGKFSAELLLMQTLDQDSDGILLAESDAVDATLDMSNPTPFKLTLTPTAEADYIPYAKGQNIQLVLRFEGAEGSVPTICCIAAITPGLKTEDFKMTLPLNEYHDKLTGLAEAGESLLLKAEGAVEKTGLPGTTMTYAFTLTNQGSTAEIIEIDLAGTDAPMGTIVPGGSIELGPKASRKLTLAVQIPTGKNNGEEIEVLIFAHSQEDPSKSAIARTKTIIGKAGSNELVSDETAVLAAAQQAETNETPGPGVLLALAGVAVTAFFARRRN